ncbi:2-keto-4-pentenoate hydratase [Croceicoccus bisphenolivorans]|uniref:2-keto-4-pentenoate hydratase n=1 Tax=Croceicoccus bisphenolivorans TaxID=1783232 RepID=UPI000832C0A3|nr:fumarylacetoacetate hydrolase family protein [Croceicoccus bisphenolivorans]
MDIADHLIDHMDTPGIDSDPERDITKLKPDMTQDEALALQLAVKRRRVARGDRIIGHQASFTSAGIRKMFPDSPRPMVGTLLHSIMRPDGEEVQLDCDDVFIESEMALVLGRDLEGDQLTPTGILAAIDGFLPAIEVAPLRPGVMEGKYSWAHNIAVQKADGGYVIFGSKITPARSIDPRTEACLVSIDGEPRAAAAGFEAMGSPIFVVGEMVKKLHAIGEKLHAGQVIMTGSLPPPQRVSGANKCATVEFGTLGAVTVRLRGVNA